MKDWVKKKRKGCCMLTSDPAKHAIPKTVEVAYSIGLLWEEIA